ncbi:MAG: hypothetical protein AB1815_11710 [Bacillota bacterium]
MDSANIQRGLNPPLNEVSFNRKTPKGTGNFFVEQKSCLSPLGLHIFLPVEGK